jgi:hypothetical protein
VVAPGQSSGRGFGQVWVDRGGPDWIGMDRGEASSRRTVGHGRTPWAPSSRNGGESGICRILSGCGFRVRRTSAGGRWPVAGGRWPLGEMGKVWVQVWFSGYERAECGFVRARMDPGRVRSGRASRRRDRNSRADSPARPIPEPFRLVVSCRGPGWRSGPRGRLSGWTGIDGGCRSVRLERSVCRSVGTECGAMTGVGGWCRGVRQAGQDHRRSRVRLERWDGAGRRGVPVPRVQVGSNAGSKQGSGRPVGSAARRPSRFVLVGRSNLWRCRVRACSTDHRSPSVMRPRQSEHEGTGGRFGLVGRPAGATGTAEPTPRPDRFLNRSGWWSAAVGSCKWYDEKVGTEM